MFSIRIRLIVSYIAMLIVPVFMIILLTALLMGVLFWGNIQEVRSLLPQYNNRQPQATEEAKQWLELTRQSVLHPDQFRSVSYLEKEDQWFAEKGTFLIVRQEQNILYRSEKVKEIPSDELPAFGSIESRAPFRKIGGELVALRQHDFFFSDGSAGTLFSIRDATPIENMVGTFFPLLLGGALLILILTNGILTYFVSRSLLRPIAKLKRAAQNIKEGNLDFQLHAESQDELGQLCTAFEEMRRKLKESIDVRLQVEENRKELISNISHDLRTPITSIKGYVEGIRDGVASSPEKMRRYLDTIYNKTIEMNRLIDELFLFSKLDLKQVPFHFTEVDLSGYIRSYVEELRLELEVKGVEVHFHQTGDLPTHVRIDRDQFHRVLSNIVGNSVKFMDKEKKLLVVTLHSAPEEITLEIQDNGRGIDQEVLPHIFERFYRAEPSRNTKTGGSGLGLSIALQIMKQHGATIRAESEPGVGTRTILTWKRKKEGSDLYE